MANRILAVCLDFGDTLADEASEVKDDTLTALRAELIPGAGELLHELKRRGYKLALVADGRPGTYSNVLRQHSVHELFDVFAISEEVGVEKPDPRMFVAALDALDIELEDYERTVMVGNRLDRDIRGANDLGMVSVWIDWSSRYYAEPKNDAEVPDFTIHAPLELLDVLDELERVD
ncbi:MAG: HAD-IA family hydrolase [Chloroflexi bacterium]|nr:HAD-IA family hydrolase [Chloroflexota bacterium]MCI0827535.1 HAD-IA family hydrolase [Chloroflexota bacterium]MCI0861865.1 HAD-IA family hydrolase [Chloroflexota bacterium]MCI0876286.1 HAD-IA family hydrolase [Chloroflexota bacterium]MCI0892581.1 HAD-IA family hydrolase [Chloroflexota bacterium]